jgi:hypothetical protein
MLIYELQKEGSLKINKIKTAESRTLSWVKKAEDGTDKSCTFCQKFCVQIERC